MSKSGNVIKMKKRVKLNIGTLIFIFIFIYLLANIIYSSKKTAISLYEVVQEDLAQELELTGVITREETMYYAVDSGYINYYPEDGSRVKKNATVYSIDSNRSIYDMLGADSTLDFTADDMQEIKRTISLFQNQYSGNDFSVVYDFKESMSGKISELSDEKLLDQMQELVESTGINSAFRFVCSERSGIISYHTDTYDGLTFDTIQSGIWDMESFSSSSLRSSERLSANDAVYKLITSDEWQITCPLSMEQYIEMQELTQLRFVITENQLKVTAPVSFFIRGSEYYMQISMDKYLSNYLSERFLNIELILKEEKGLKIPVSAVTMQEFYLIPSTCLTMGGDSSTDVGITTVTYDPQTGEPFFEFQPVEVFYEENGYSYIEKSVFPVGTMIFSQTKNAETGETKDEVLPLSMTGELEGVYCVNKGYAQFRRIERIKADEEYIIVKAGTTRGISVYDHIAMDAKTITDSAIIY